MPPTPIPHQYLIDFINIYGSITSLIVSIILGILSIWLSIVFFRSAKASEGETAKILEAIKNNVTTLNTINNDLLSKALQHLASSNSQMIDIIGQYNQNIKAASSQPANIDKKVVFQPANKSTESMDIKNIREAILAAIKFLTVVSGNAFSFQLFKELERSYDFETILFELIRMAIDNLITWDGAPQAPEALSSIKIVPEETKKV